MRVVLYTNVLVSAALKQASFPALAVRLVEQRGVLLKSVATEGQLFEVLARPYFASAIDPRAHVWLKQLLAAAELVTITEVRQDWVPVVGFEVMPTDLGGP